MNVVVSQRRSRTRRALDNIYIGKNTRCGPAFLDDVADKVEEALEDKFRSVRRARACMRKSSPSTRKSTKSTRSSTDSSEKSATKGESRSSQRYRDTKHSFVTKRCACYRLKASAVLLIHLKRAPRQPQPLPPRRLQRRRESVVKTSPIAHPQDTSKAPPKVQSRSPV